jgi:hypothetical protein
MRIRFQKFLFKADRRIRAHLVALVSKPALAKLQGSSFENASFAEL